MSGYINIQEPRQRTIEVWPVDAKYARPDAILAQLNEGHRVGRWIYRARVLEMTAGCFDIAADVQIEPDEVDVFQWRTP